MGLLDFLFDEYGEVAEDYKVNQKRILKGNTKLVKRLAMII